ncbi:MAG: hypothetical protein V3R98_12520 [Alphaproteobacteria bacterium]
MPQADGIIAKFGGTRPMAAALGVPPSTVQGWKRGGYIPARRQAQVLTAARRLGIDIAPDDFFDLGREETRLGRAPGL